MNCIIIDDEEMARAIIEQFTLQNNNLTLDAQFSDAIQAIKYLNQHHVDLIFLDIRRKDLIVTGGENVNPIEVEGALINIDGIRAEYEDGWGLVRPSNTSPYMILRFEADTELVLERIQSEFRTIINLIKPNAKIPF